MRFWKYILGFDPNRMRLFPGQQPGEEIELMTVRHWIILIPFFGQLIVLSLGLLWLNYGLLSAQLPEELFFYTNVIAVSTLVHAFFMKMFNHYLRVIIITNYRVIDIRNTIFFYRERESIPMSNIQDFRVKQHGLLPRIFKYGELYVIGANSEIQYHLKCIPNVNMVHHLLSGLHQINLMQQQGHMRQQQETTQWQQLPPQVEQ
ncbi:MAG: PH domain-containing protein [Candidatus Gracilibacteria bacterium]|nr:PH domain-containing protein [Candidatus Gracilibacteria bacterium]